MENEYLFNKLLWDKMSIGMQQKKNPDKDLTTYTKINSKWITDLTINLKVIKLLEKKKNKSTRAKMEKYFEGLLWDYMLHKGGQILFILVFLGPNTETGR